MWGGKKENRGGNWFQDKRRVGGNDIFWKTPKIVEDAQKTKSRVQLGKKGNVKKMGEGGLWGSGKEKRLRKTMWVKRDLTCKRNRKGKNAEPRGFWGNQNWEKKSQARWSEVTNSS